jgi:hypothetical protein
MKIVSQKSSAITVGPEPEKGKGEFQGKDGWKEWRHRSERLQAGEERKFERIGAKVGRAILEVASTIQ